VVLGAEPAEPRPGQRQVAEEVVATTDGDAEESVVGEVGSEQRRGDLPVVLGLEAAVDHVVEGAVGREQLDDGVAGSEQLAGHLHQRLEHAVGLEAARDHLPCLEQPAQPLLGLGRRGQGVRAPALRAGSGGGRLHPGGVVHPPAYRRGVLIEPSPGDWPISFVARTAAWVRLVSPSLCSSAET
jgi:hypothetical protein